MTDVRELVVKFLGDNTDLKKKSEGAMSALDGVAKAAKIATGAAVTLAAGLLVLAKHQSNVGDEAGKAALRLGIATEQMTRLHYQAGLAGVESEQFNATLTIMQRNLAAAAGGADQQSAAFNVLGLKTSELLGMSTDKQFQKIGIELAKIENPTLRAAVATQIFGRSGTQMLDIINQGEEGFKKAAEEADRFGLTISAIDAANLNAANDAISKVGEAANGAARQFAVGLAPAISSIIERLLGSVDVAGEFREAGKELGRTLAEAMDFAVLAVLQFDKAMLNTIGYIALATNALQKFYGQDSTGSFAFLGEVDDKIAELDKKIAAASAGSGNSWRDTVAGAEADKGGSTGKGTKSARDELLLKLLNPENAKKATDAMKAFEKAAQEAVKTQIDLNNKVADSFISMKDSLLQGGDLLENFKKTALNTVNDIFNSLIKLSFGGTSGGGIGGSIASMIFGAVSGSTGGLFGGGYSDIGGGEGINWYPTTGFAKGGSFMVGGDGGTDSGMVKFKATRGEKVTVETPSQQGSGGGSGGVTVIQNIQIGTGVSIAVRQEVAKMLPDLRRATIAGVSDAQLRGNI